MTISPQLAFVFYLVIHPYLRLWKSKWLWLAHQLKLNIVPLRLPLLKLSGYITCCLNLVFIPFLAHNFFVIIHWLSLWRIILSFMPKQNTLIWIATLFRTALKNNVSYCSRFLLNSNLLIFWLRPYPLLDFTLSFKLLLQRIINLCGVDNRNTWYVVLQ